ncbi:MAG TPA: hypothetical protein VJ600_10050 [Holophagaceae bacterium]|nr:hypothetical protein [Holophagaceae bacterium]
MPAATRFAFLSLGNLYLWEGQGEPRLWESPFAKEVLRRHEEIQKRHQWKTEGRGARFMMGGMAWEMPEEGGDGGQAPVIMSLSRGPREGELMYALRVAGVHGICALDWASLQEQRLVHAQRSMPLELSGGPGREKVLCSLPASDGTAALGLMDADGGQIVELTEGDSADGAPSWDPRDEDRVVFQSSGIGRNGRGEFVAYGPSAIQGLRLSTGEMETLLASERHDFIAPRLDPDGVLYCIRRPYASRHRTSFGAFLLDILKAPFRLVGAVFQYLNHFSSTYTGSPLISARGGRRGADWRRLQMLANRMDAAGDAGRAGEPLVPKEWVLLRKGPGAEPEVVAENVLSFDLLEGGGLLYTTGTKVFARRPGAAWEPVLDHPGIQQVVALPS